MTRCLPLFGFFIILLSILVLGADCQDGDERSCGYDDTGECTSGIQYCQNSFWSMCYGTKGPVPELCDDNKDNDCDGQTDEQCDCTDGQTQPCGPPTEEGICTIGTQTCINGTWDTCNGAIFSFQEELCGQNGLGNNADDDCDGQTDEGCRQAAQPPLTTCFNGIQDLEEEGIDCGGPHCKTCQSCDDRILNQDEERVSQDLGNSIISDCGGPHCPSCPTCTDAIQNQAEEGIDCGGPCPQPCTTTDNADADHDGLTYAQEIALGSSPTNPDTDNDGIPDGQDAQPLCPDGVCQERFGETPRTCSDCTQPSNAPLYIFLTLFAVFIGAILYFYTKMRHTKALKKTPMGSTPQSQPPFDQKKYNELTSRQQKKTKHTKVEDDIERSFTKFNRYFKK